MKILITGDAGFVGRAFRGKFEAEGHEIVGIDRQVHSQSQWGTFDHLATADNCCKMNHLVESCVVSSEEVTSIHRQAIGNVNPDNIMTLIFKVSVECSTYKSGIASDKNLHEIFPCCPSKYSE